jgi:hypothetical protein
MSRKKYESHLFRTILVRGKEVFIVGDVHKGSWHVTARMEGEEVFHGGIPSEYHALQRLFDHFRDCKIKVAHEVGTCRFWLYDPAVLLIVCIYYGNLGMGIFLL